MIFSRGAVKNKAGGAHGKSVINALFETGRAQEHENSFVLNECFAK